jgi:hypothetical protein
MVEVTLEKLLELMESKNPRDLEPMGGVSGIAQQLGSDVQGGLRQTSKQDLDLRQEKFGENKVERKPPPTLVELFVEAMQDTTIIILLFAAGSILFFS